MTRIDVRSDGIVFSTPGLEGHQVVSLRRTVRLAEAVQGRKHALPPDLGPAAVAAVETYADRLPPGIVARGGVIVPLNEGEAFWMRFTENRPWRPSALMCAAGKINAIDGKYWEDKLVGPFVGGPSQNYVVVGGPRASQPWLDGWRTEDGTVRQFVAVARGNGASVEEQLTGASDNGGVQLRFFEAHMDAFPRGPVYRPPQGIAARGPMLSHATAKSGHHLESFSVDRSISLSDAEAFGVGAGAEITQVIVPSTYDLATWDRDAPAVRVFIHLVPAELWARITGTAAPTSFAHQTPSAPSPLIGIKPVVDVYSGTGGIKSSKF